MAKDAFGNEVYQKPVNPDGTFGGLEIMNTTPGAMYSRTNPGTVIGQTPRNPLLDTANYTKPKTALDTAKEKMEKTLLEDVVAPNEEEERAKARVRAQAIVDQINLSYQPVYADAAAAAGRRDRRTQALSIASGAAGSDFATASAERTSEVNAKDKALIDQQRMAKIQEVMYDLDNRATEEYKQKREEYLRTIEGNYEKIKEFQASQTEAARNNAIQLAGQGIDLTALRDQSPELYQQLLEETGYSPAVFNAFYNSQLPENQQRKYEYKTVGNKTYAISFNPATKKIESEEIEMPGGGYDQFMIAPDGTPLFIDKTNGKVQVAGGFNEGQFIKPTTKSTNPQPSSMTKDLEDAYAAISQGADIDAVRREFLKDYPKASAQFNSYTKKTKTSNNRTQ